MKVKKYGVVIPVSRELLTEAGAVKRTPAEEEQRARDVAESKARKSAAQPRLHAALAALDAIKGPDREILDLHEPVGRYPDCHGCDFEGYEAECPAWPCRTTELIAARHGIDLSNFHWYDPDWKP